MSLPLSFLFRDIIAALAKSLKGSKRILDIGCGDHPFYRHVLRGAIIGVDRQRAKAADVVADAHDLPFGNCICDGIACVNSLYFYADPQAAVIEFSRVLGKNGTLFLVTPFLYPIHDKPFDKYRFTEYGLRHLMERGGFTIDTIIPVGGGFSLPSLIVHFLYKGALRFLPSKDNRIVGTIVDLLFLPPGLVAMGINYLNSMDKSGRWPVYYVTVARKS